MTVGDVARTVEGHTPLEAPFLCRLFRREANQTLHRSLIGTIRPQLKSS